MKTIKYYLDLLYSRIQMGYYKHNFFIKLLPILEYVLFPEFRRKTYPVYKISKIVTISFLMCFLSFFLINNIIELHEKNYELYEVYNQFGNLVKDAKQECLDSLQNSSEYIKYTFYQKSGIRITNNIPAKHLLSMKDNAKKMGIPLAIYVRVINRESHFDSSAVNKTSGASGYMQIMPRTFNYIYKKCKLIGGKTVANNLFCGSYLLKQNFKYWYKRRNNKQAWEMALACYNMGDSIPIKTGRVPNAAKEYVKYIMNE